MSNVEIIALWVGIIALILFAICAVLYIWYRKRAHGSLHTNQEKSNEHKKRTDSKELKEAEANRYTSNSALDGARVSHRRNHPDRIAEETQWKERKEREDSEIQKKLELDRKNRLLMIFSPCNADVLSIHENTEEAVKDGYQNPGVVLLPSDDKMYAPMNGTITWDDDKNSELRIVSDTGTEVLIKAKLKDPQADELIDCFQMKVERNSMVGMGDLIGSFHNGLVKKNNKNTIVSMELSSYRKGQLVLLKRSNYVSHGDKIITIRLDS